MVGGVDDSGSVGAGEDIGGGQGSEGPQHSGLGAEGDLLALAEGTWGERNKSNRYERCLGQKSHLPAIQ